MARRETIFLSRPGTGDYGSDWRVYAEGLTPASAILTTKALEAQGEVVMRVRVLGKQTYLTPTSYDQMTASTMTANQARTLRDGPDNAVVVCGVTPPTL